MLSWYHWPHSWSISIRKNDQDCSIDVYKSKYRRMIFLVSAFALMALTAAVREIKFDR